VSIFFRAPVSRISMPIWSKGGDTPDALVHQFTVGDDYLFDRVLAPYDVLGSLAHATMLGEARIISQDDQQALLAGLRALYREFQAGSWTVEAADEDVHSKVEALLTQRLGDPAKRVHTGRSRNDQVMTDVRLWQKDKMIDIALGTLAAAEALAEQAQRHEFHPFPGYTHMQRGMPSSVGQFFGGHATALLEDLGPLRAAYGLADHCPLGSGAGYGVGLPLDRERTSGLLGFEGAVRIAMADSNSRGKVEGCMLDALACVVGDLSRLAADIVFFTTGECGFFTIEKGYTTGSSIMPQKKNWDVFELLRGRAARFLGLRTGLAATALGLVSGYNRDVQDTKAVAVEGARIAEQCLAIVPPAVRSMAPVRERIVAALTPDLYATDVAYQLVMEKGIPFRDAYIQVGQHIDEVQAPDHDATVRNRTHTGSTGNLRLPELLAAIREERAHWQGLQDRLHSTWDHLLAPPGPAAAAAP
jgi:argininosuccinate lyase